MLWQEEVALWSPGCPLGHSGASSPPKAPGDCFIPPEPELGTRHMSLKPCSCLCLWMTDAVAAWERLPLKESSVLCEKGAEESVF